MRFCPPEKYSLYIVSRAYRPQRGRGHNIITQHLAKFCCVYRTVLELHALTPFGVYKPLIVYNQNINFYAVLMLMLVVAVVQIASSCIWL